MPKGNCKKWTWALMASSVLFISFAAGLHVVSGGTLVVPDNYPTIQKAVNAANLNTVYVREGTYYEHVTIDKPLILQGESRNATIMDGGGIGNVIYIGANTVVIQGLTVRNGSRGILLYYADHCEIDDVLPDSCQYGIRFRYSSYNSVHIIATNKKEIEIDIYRSSHHNTLRNIKVYPNTYSGISAVAGSDYTILDSYVHDNYMGINIGWFSSWSIENTVVHADSIRTECNPANT